MQGRSGYLNKSMVACLAVLSGAGIGGLVAGFNARTGLSPAPSPAVLAAVAEMAPAETVNLRFPADWSDAAATPAEAAPQMMAAFASADRETDAAPQRVALASADSRMVLFSPSPAYPFAAEPAAAAPVAAAAEPVPQPLPRPRPAQAAAKPHSNAVLNDAQIAGIKKRLNLTPDQERYWPAVEAELRKMEYAKRATAGGNRAASVDMSKVNVEGLKSAGYPLVMSFSDDQRRELKSLAHLLGLESVMAGL
ncbi:MAG TPA: hypothetical protein VH397_09335 [Xanthobacteraceae bacterium]|jgi:hypothetical protein